MSEVPRSIKSKKNPTIISCFKKISLTLLLCGNAKINLILYEGTTKVIKGRTRIKAGEIMFQFPDCVVCHADSFFLGRPVPALAIHDHLVAGQSYFVLPLDRLPRGGAPLSATSLQWLSSPSTTNSGNTSPSSVIISNHNMFCNSNVNSNSNNNSNSKSPFDYIKDKDGRVLMIKVVPEFITKIISPNNNNNNNSKSPCNNINNNSICTTPELQKQYEQLVRAKDQAWSPRLETISEVKIRFSPSKLLRLEWVMINQKQIK